MSKHYVCDRCDTPIRGLRTTLEDQTNHRTMHSTYKWDLCRACYLFFLEFIKEPEE